MNISPHGTMSGGLRVQGIRKSAICSNAEGHLLSQLHGRSCPIFVADVLAPPSATALAIYGKENLHEDDIVITNDAGTIGAASQQCRECTRQSLRPDTAELAAFFVVVVHWLDVGGRVIGVAVQYCDRHLPGRHSIPPP